MAPQVHVDIAVVGAGPAGATAARLLAYRGKQVLVIDSGPNITDRLEILSPSAMGVVSALQLNEVLLDTLITRPCAGIRRRWTSQNAEFDDFLHRPGGIGFVVDRKVFDARLRAMAQEAGASLFAGRVLSARRQREGFRLEIGRADGIVSLSTALVVDATGRAGALARRLGAERILGERLVAERQTFDQSGLPSQEAVWLDVEARNGLWVYELLGPDGRREGWVVHRHEHRRSTRGQRFNASAACLSPAAGPNWIAIGDAAAAFDPIASQGLINALSSAMVSVGAILQEGDISLEAATHYSAAVIETFVNSEQGRRNVYRSMLFE